MAGDIVLFPPLSCGTMCPTEHLKHRPPTHAIPTVTTPLLDLPAMVKSTHAYHRFGCTFAPFARFLSWFRAPAAVQPEPQQGQRAKKNSSEKSSNQPPHQSPLTLRGPRQQIPPIDSAVCASHVVVPILPYIIPLARCFRRQTSGGEKCNLLPLTRGKFIPVF